VTQIIDDILESKKGNDCRVLKHLLSFAEHQFGKNGERISNWIVDIGFVYRIIQILFNLYGRDTSLSTIVQDDLRFPYLERSLSLLNNWVINVDSDASKRIDCLNEDQINSLVEQLFCMEQNMAVITINRRQFDLAKGHSQRCLAHSRRYGLEGEKKITMIFQALEGCCSLQDQQDNHSCSLSFAEECYNLVVEAYDPVHPQVQEAAGLLINILSRRATYLTLSVMLRSLMATFEIKRMELIRRVWL
jgi:hypothetical protein